jgi:hypothetical protein
MEAIRYFGIFWMDEWTKKVFDEERRQSEPVFQTVVEHLEILFGR